MTAQIIHSELKSDKQALATVLQYLKTQNLTVSTRTLYLIKNINSVINRNNYSNELQL